MKEQHIQEKTLWYQELNSHEHIYIFGAGISAIYTLNYIENCIDKMIEGFIVSDITKNPTVIKNYPVKDIYDKKLYRDALVIMSTSAENNEVIKQIIKKAGFKDIIPSGVQMVTPIVEKEWYGLHGKENKGNAKIYIVTSHLNQHKCDVQFGGVNCACYIQAGASLTDIRMCDVLDNVGDNISYANEYYCELTAGYWIYKNDNIHDYLGLFHYSRGLDLNDEDISMIIRNDVDVVLPVGMKCSQQMACRLHKKDIQRLYYAINDQQMRLKLEKYLLGYNFYVGNIIFARAEIYKEYYRWMMGVLRRCEKDVCNDNILIPKRLWGYYGEHLTNVFFTDTNYKIVLANLIVG